MEIKYRRGLAIVLAVMLAVSAALMLGSCGKSGGSSVGGSGNSGSENSSSGEKDYDTEKAYVAGKCFVLIGMSSEDEDFDEELIKEIFDIDDIGDYMSIYFEKGGTAYVKSLLYGDGVQKGMWGEKDGVTLMEVKGELYEIEVNDDGTISSTTVEEDGEGFLITFREPDEVPECFKEYVK